MQVLQLRAVEARDATAFLGRSGQQIAALIDDRDVAGGKLGNTGCDEVDDACDLPGVDHATGPQLHEDRGAGLLVLPDEHGGPRDREMHAGLLDLGHRLDRLGEVTFEGPLVVDLLGELADAESLVVHQLEADAAGLRQALRCELEAGLVDLVRRHEDRTAAVRDPVRDVHLGQLRDDRPAVLLGDVGEQDLVVGRACRDQGDHDDGDDAGDAGDQAELAGVGELVEAPREGEEGFAGCLCHERCQSLRLACS